MDGKLEKYQKTWKDSKIRLEGPVEGFSQVVLGNVWGEAQSHLLQYNIRQQDSEKAFSILFSKHCALWVFVALAARKQEGFEWDTKIAELLEVSDARRSTEVTHRGLRMPADDVDNLSSLQYKGPTLSSLFRKSKKSDFATCTAPCWIAAHVVARWIQ